MIIHLFNSSIVSGPETLVLPALLKLGEPVHIVFLSETRLLSESKGPVQYAQSLGHTVHEVAVRGRFDRKAFHKLRALLDELKPDIVHAHDVKASLYLLQAKKTKPHFLPLIVSTHHGASYRKGKIRLYEEIYVRLVFPKFDLALAVCKVDQESIIRRGVPPDKVKLHLNGTDRMRVDAKDRPALQIKIRERWRENYSSLTDVHTSMPNDAIFLGAVARLSPEKRHDRMLTLIHELKKSRGEKKKTILLCFGIGPEEERLKKLAHSLGIEDLVFWMGYSKTISQEMAGLDLILCLSDGEGIPINLIEAGWAGTPVLATEVGGIPDLIGTRATTPVGILVQKSDTDQAIAKKVREVLDDAKNLTELGLAFQNRVSSEFSESAWLNRLREIYADLKAIQPDTHHNQTGGIAH